MLKDTELLNIYIPDEIDYVVTGGMYPEKKIFERKETKSHKEKMKAVAKTAVIKDTILTDKNGVQSGFKLRVDSGGIARIYDYMNHQLTGMHTDSIREILNTCAIDKTIILENFVYGILNASGFLIRVGSDLHKQATENTARRNQTTNVKTIKPGSIFLTKNGKRGRLIGKVKVYGLIGKFDYNKSEEVAYGNMSDKPFFAYFLLDNRDVVTGIALTKAINASQVVKADDVPVQTLTKEANELINRNLGTYNFINITSREIWNSNILFIEDDTVDLKVNTQFRIEKIGDWNTVKTTPKYDYLGDNAVKFFVAENPVNKTVDRLDRYHIQSAMSYARSITGFSLDYDKFQNDVLEHVIGLNNVSSWRGNVQERGYKRTEISIANPDYIYYKMYFEVTTDTGLFFTCT